MGGHQSSVITGTDHQPTSDQPADEDESTPQQKRRYSQINCEIINSFCWHTSLSRKGDDLAVCGRLWRTLDCVGVWSKI